MVFVRLQRYTNAVSVRISSGFVSVGVMLLRKDVHLLPDRVLIDEARIALGRESSSIFGAYSLGRPEFKPHWDDGVDEELDVRSNESKWEIQFDSEDLRFRRSNPA